MGKGCRKKIPTSRYVNPVDINPDNTDLSSSDESNKDNNNAKNTRTINSDYTPQQYRNKSRKNLHVEPIATNKEFSDIIQ